MSTSTTSSCASDVPCERRQKIRYGCVLSGECQPITALEAGNHWPAQTTDISATGVALLLSRRFEPGTFLAVELAGASAEPQYMPLARVCRVAIASKHWLLGCTWASELGADELRSLVGSIAVWKAFRQRLHSTLGRAKTLTDAPPRLAPATQLAIDLPDVPTVVVKAAA